MMEKVNFRQKKAHLMEIQINGGSVEKRVRLCFNVFVFLCLFVAHKSCFSTHSSLKPVAGPLES